MQPPRGRGWHFPIISRTGLPAKHIIIESKLHNYKVGALSVMVHEVVHVACQKLTIFPRIWEMMTEMGFYRVGCDMFRFYVIV